MAKMNIALEFVPDKYLLYVYLLLYIYLCLFQLNLVNLFNGYKTMV